MCFWRNHQERFFFFGGGGLSFIRTWSIFFFLHLFGCTFQMQRIKLSPKTALTSFLNDNLEKIFENCLLLTSVIAPVQKQLRPREAIELATNNCNYILHLSFSASFKLSCPVLITEFSPISLTMVWGRLLVGQFLVSSPSLLGEWHRQSLSGQVPLRKNLVCPDWRCRKRLLQLPCLPHQFLVSVVVDIPEFR